MMSSANVVVRDHNTVLSQGLASIGPTDTKTGNYRLSVRSGDNTGDVLITPFMFGAGGKLNPGETIDMCALKSGDSFAFVYLIGRLQITTKARVGKTMTRTLPSVGEVPVFEIEFMDSFAGPDGPSSGKRQIEYAPSLGIALKISSRFYRNASSSSSPMPDPYPFTYYALGQTD